jgi:hypothetical protein
MDRWMGHVGNIMLEIWGFWEMTAENIEELLWLILPSPFPFPFPLDSSIDSGPFDVLECSVFTGVMLGYITQVETGGEDAYFVEGVHWVGVADGVGGWALSGIYIIFSFLSLAFLPLN